MYLRQENEEEKTEKNKKKTFEVSNNEFWHRSTKIVPKYIA